MVLGTPGLETKVLTTWERRLAMDLDDFWEPEVAVTAGVAAAVAAAAASPRVRKALRQGAVYGLAGLMIAGDKIVAAARGLASSAQQATANAGALGWQLTDAEFEQLASTGKP